MVTDLTRLWQFLSQEGNSKTCRYLAVSAIGEKAAIFIFDTMSHKRKKTLLGDANIRDFISL
jgi:hypothetical protein